MRHVRALATSLVLALLGLGACGESRTITLEPDQDAAVVDSHREISVPDAAVDAAVPDVAIPDLAPAPDGPVDPTGTEWVATAHGTNQVSPADMVVDSAGNIYVTGDFDGNASFGATTLVSNGNTDFFVAKLDPDGNWLWATSAGATDPDNAWGIALSPSGSHVHVTGSYSGDVSFWGKLLPANGPLNAFAVKLDAAGNFASVTTIPTKTTGTDIAVDASDNVYLLGTFEGTATFGTLSLSANGQDEIYVAKQSPTGAFLWALGAGSATYGDHGSTLALDGAGNLYVAGSVEGPGTIGTAALPGKGVFVARLGPAGNVGWASLVPQPTALMPGWVGLAVDSTGHARLAGFFDVPFTVGSTSLTPTPSPTKAFKDAYLVDVDSAGGVGWAQGGGGPHEDRARAVAVDSAGNSYVAGIFSGQAAFGAVSLVGSAGLSIFVLKVDAAGMPLWAIPAGGGNDWAASIALDSAGNLVVGGHFDATAAFGPVTKQAAGKKDLFVWKLKPSL